MLFQEKTLIIFMCIMFYISLSIATQFNFPAGYDIMDLGTGGGFPGIPLAIFFRMYIFIWWIVLIKN